MGVPVRPPTSQTGPRAREQRLKAGLMAAHLEGLQGVKAKLKQHPQGVFTERVFQLLLGISRASFPVPTFYVMV